MIATLAVVAILLPLAWWFGGRLRRPAFVIVALSSLACSLGQPGSQGSGDSAEAIINPPAGSTLAIYPSTIAPKMGMGRYLTAVKTAPGGARAAVAVTWTIANPDLATVTGSGSRVLVTGSAIGKTTVTAQVDGLTALAVVDINGIDPLDPGTIYGCSETDAVLTRYTTMGSNASPVERWRAPDVHWSRGMAFTMSRSGASLWIGAAAPVEEEGLSADCAKVYRYDFSSGNATLYGTLGGNVNSGNPATSSVLHYVGFDSVTTEALDCVVTYGSDRNGNGGGRFASWVNSLGGSVKPGGYDPVYSDIAATGSGTVYYGRDAIDTGSPIVYRGDWRADGYPEYVSIPGPSMPDLAQEGASSGIAADENHNLYVGGRKSGRVWRYHDATGVGLAAPEDVVLFGSLTNSSESSLVVNGITTTKNGGILVNVVQGSAAVPAGIYFMIDMDGDGRVDPDLGEVIRYSPHPVMNTLDGGCIVATR